MTDKKLSERMEEWGAWDGEADKWWDKFYASLPSIMGKGSEPRDAFQSFVNNQAQDWALEVAALEAENASLLAANARLAGALHPGPKPNDDVYRDFNGRWMTHKYSIGYDSNVHWCRAANKYEFVTGRKVDE